MRSVPLHDVSEIQSVLRRDGMDAALVISPRNLWLLTGYPRWRRERPGSRRSACAIAFRDAEPILVSGRYQEEISLIRAWASHVTSYADYVESPLAKAAEVLGRRGLGKGRIGFESRYLPMVFFDDLASGLKGAELVPWDDQLDAVWNAKLPQEREVMRKNLDRLSGIVTTVLAASRTGDTEESIHKRMLAAIRGAGSPDCWGRVVAGDRIRTPNALPEPRPLNPGELVRVEYACTFRSYPARVARTAVVGPPSAEQAGSFRRYLSALRPAIAGVGAGQAGQEIHQRLASALSAGGFALKGSSAGSALGIAFFERPAVHPWEGFCTMPGAILCLEPETADGYKASHEVEITTSGYAILDSGGPALEELQVIPA